MRLADTLKRFFLAWLAAAASAGLCLWYCHDLVDVNHPMSLFLLFRHETGLLMALCILWLWYEAVRMMVSPAGFRQTMHWPRVHLQRRLAKMRGFERV